MTRSVPALLALSLTLALVACNRTPDAQQSGQTRYHGRTLAEWWQLRRDPDDAVEVQANTAMHALGAAAVPFLAEKAASHDLGDMIGGSTTLESMCQNVIPAMEAARSRYPSPALDAAIVRVRRDGTDPKRYPLCVARPDSARRDSARRDSARRDSARRGQ